MFIPDLRLGNFRSENDMALTIGNPNATAAGETVDDDRISWAAIFAGAACALALQIMFALAAAGLGLEMVDDGDPSGAGWGTGIFFAITSIASMFAGGSIAGRLAGASFVPSAVLHGVVVWALVLFGVTWMGVSATGSLLSGARQAATSAGSTVTSAAGTAADAVGSVVSAVTPDMENLQTMNLEALVPPSMEQDLRRLMGDDVTPEQVAEEMRAIADEVIDEGELENARQIVVDAGRRMLRKPGDAEAIFQQAVDRMTRQGGPLGEQQFTELKNQVQQRFDISDEEAAKITDRWQAEYVEARDAAIETYRETYNSVAQEVNEAVATAEETAKAAADAFATAAWWAAVGAFLGLLAAAVGAAFGRPEDITSEPAAVSETRD